MIVPSWREIVSRASFGTKDQHADLRYNRAAALGNIRMEWIQNYIKFNGDNY